MNGGLRYTYLFLLLIFFSCRKNSSQNINPPSPELPIEIPPPVLTPVTFKVNEAIGGYYEALPANYATNNQSYPLLVFIHGGGGFGNGQIDLPILLNDGIPQLLDEKKFPAEFIINGEHFSFVHLAPQFNRQPTHQEVYSFINFAKEHYNVDTSRIYAAGLSNGGRIACEVAAIYPTLFSAIVPMAGVADTANMADKCASLASANLPLWVFHNDKDEVSNIIWPVKFISLLNSFNPSVEPKFTIFTPMGLLGHDAWTRATDPAYKEENRNIYEWMLQYSR